MRQCKPRAHLQRECTGWFFLDPYFRWVARDRWNNWIASGNTRKECEEETRKKGYVPESQERR